MGHIGCCCVPSLCRQFSRMVAPASAGCICLIISAPGPSPYIPLSFHLASISHPSVQIEQWVDTAIAVAAVGAAPTDLLTALDSHIATRSYFAGYDLSLADIALATTLQALVEPGAWAAHHHLNRWFGLCTELLGLGAAGAGAGAGSSSKPSTAAKGAPKAAGAPSAPAAAGGEITARVGEGGGGEFAGG
jgi:hypothetical protein